MEQTDIRLLDLTMSTANLSRIIFARRYECDSNVATFDSFDSFGERGRYECGQVSSLKIARQHVASNSRRESDDGNDIVSRPQKSMTTGFTRFLVILRKRKIEEPNQ